MLPTQKALFDIPQGVTYLNCAYMSPMLSQAVNAGLRGMQLKARPWEIKAKNFFDTVELARALAAEIVGCSSNDISLIPSASYGIATAANNIALDLHQEIIVLEDQFPSNVFCWIDSAKTTGSLLKTVLRPVDGDWTQAILNTINSKTRLAALPHCHWKDGSLLDLKPISDRLKEYGAALVIDTTQSLGAMPLDFDAIQPNFIIAACYKWLLGPYSTGILYAAPQHQQGRPIEFGWANRIGADQFNDLATYEDQYQVGARRYDMGERSNFALLPPLITGFQQILKWGIPSIYESISRLTDLAANQARKREFTVGNKDKRSGHFLGITLPPAAPSNLVTLLEQEGIFVSIRGNSLRITPHVYNTEEDINVLFAALDRLL